MKLTLTTPVTQLRMVGAAYATRLRRLGIDTVDDLLLHPPHRYIDYSRVSTISRVQPGEVVTIQGTVLECTNIRTRHGKLIQKLVVTDGTGRLQVTWFNQPYLPQSMRQGEKINLAGEVKRAGTRKELISPEYESVKDKQPIHTGRLIPVYPETRGVSSKWLRSRIAPLLPLILPSIVDWLPQEILKQENLTPLHQAIGMLHFPDTLAAAQASRKRLAFDELFSLQVVALLRKRDWQRRKVTTPMSFTQDQLTTFRNTLPFSLTQAQDRCLAQILDDMSRPKPMNRLLLGDVGSGKTVVAAGAMYAAHLNHAKSMIMAPTEILANQHEQTITSLLKPLGLKVALVTASKVKGLESFDIIVGTQALLYGRVRSAKYGLAVIDEQHRFGVEQRAMLIRKGSAPHTLTMTATPIPRTVALTLYGDLDLSILDEMPIGRKRVKTWVVPPTKRQSAYQWMRERILLGEQAFIVCPLIEESQHETMLQVKAASDEYDHLAREVFPELSLGLLHGRMKAAHKQEALDAFRSGKTNILVTTPVVEVGIDIPLATIMLIEGAERFGLAQLHQLRGRVGRRDKEGYCLLFASTPHSGIRRLKALETTKSGSELAELDLKIRGPGEMFGMRQHGYDQLHFANFSDTQAITKARSWARRILEEDPELVRYPQLSERLHSLEKAVEPN